MSIFLIADKKRTDEKDGYEIPSFALVIPAKKETEIIEDLDQLIRIRHKNYFLKTLFRFIDERGFRDTDVYKAALVERKYFSKIRNNSIPKKHTVMALGLALHLSLDEMNELLQSAGYALSDTRREDLIVRWCIAQKIYDVIEVNQILYDKKAQLLR